MGIQKLLGIGAVQPSRVALNPYHSNYSGNNFIKKSFNYGEANPNRPETRVMPNALGDAPKGCGVYYLA